MPSTGRRVCDNIAMIKENVKSKAEMTMSHFGKNSHNED